MQLGKLPDRIFGRSISHRASSCVSKKTSHLGKYRYFQVSKLCLAAKELLPIKYAGQSWRFKHDFKHFDLRLPPTIPTAYYPAPMSRSLLIGSLVLEYPLVGSYYTYRYLP